MDTRTLFKHFRYGSAAASIVFAPLLMGAQAQATGATPSSAGNLVQTSPEDVPEATEAQWDSAYAAYDAVMAQGDDDVEVLVEPSSQEIEVDSSPLGLDEDQSEDLPEELAEYEPTPFDVRTERYLVPLIGESETVSFDGRHMNIASSGDGSADVIETVTGHDERHSIVINDSSAPESYAFATEVPDEEGNLVDVNLVPDEENPGGYLIASAEGDVAARIDAPWARTATGDSVETWFEVEPGPDGEDTLVQQVDHSALSSEDYPVVADPRATHTCGYVTCTLYFSVKFSSTINHYVAVYGGSSQAVATLLCAPLSWGAPVCAAIIAVKSENLRHMANQAAHEGRCLGYKYPVGTPGGGWFQTNSPSNSNCHPK